MENRFAEQNGVQYTIDVYRSKKAYYRKLAWYLVLLIAFGWCFWDGSGHFFTEDYYYPKIVVIMPIAIIVILFLLIRDSALFLGKKPLFTLDRQGIQLYEKPCSLAGQVRWQDLDGYREIALDGRKRKIVLFAKNPMQYIDAIPQTKKRKQYLKACEENSGGLLWIETSEMEYDLDQLKKNLSASMSSVA